MEDMEYTESHKPNDKPMSEYTDEEREEFVKALGQRYTEEQLDALAMAGQAIKVAGTWLFTPENREYLLETFRITKRLVEALSAEIDNDPEYGEMTLDELLEGDRLERLLERAGARASLPTISPEAIHELDFPLDKLNSNVWWLAETGNVEKYIAVEDQKDKRAGREINVSYSIDFSELDGLEGVTITKALNPYDRRVYIAMAAIINSGQKYMTIQQIYSAMGYKGRAGASDLKKVNSAITKMNMAHVTVDNEQESEAYQSKPHFRYDGSLLPMERVTAIVNGQESDGVVHLFREPPLVSFAREREQITTVSVRLLSSPLSKTNANIRLEEYLINRIARMKNGKAPNVMILETVYARTGNTTTKQKQRAWPKIQKLLDYYKECGYIRGFRRETDPKTKKEKVRILLNGNRK